MISDETISGMSTSGTDFVLSPASHMPASILASSTAGDAVIEIGVRTSADPATYRRILAPRILPAGQAARIRLPPLRMNADSGAVLIAKSDQMVSWLVANQMFATSGRLTALRSYSTRPNARTAIFAPSTTLKRWRVSGVVCCNPTASSSLMTLSISRQEGPSIAYRDIAGPVLVPPYGSMRIAVPQVVDAEKGPYSLYGTSETASIWHAYGVLLP